jgi:hypothetical protein
MARIGGRGRREDSTETAVAAAHANWVEPSTFGRQAIVASATRVDIPQINARRRKATEANWQAEAWHHYNRCGELQYAATWMANSLSRLRLYAAEVGEDGRPGKPADNAKAQKIAHQLFGGPNQAGQMLAQLGVHLTVPGDAFIVAESDPQSPQDDWYIISTSELVKKNGVLGVDRGDGWRPLNPDTTVLIRVWNPHPQRYEEATSAARACLPVLRELEKLDQHVHATLESRLPAGILFLPDNISFRAPTPEAQAASGSVDSFMSMLTEAMMAAIEDRDSPASLVPITVKVPPDAMNSVQHISFGNDLIAAVATMREAAIRRLALGLDMPPEQLLGMGDSNHWSSWQIEEGGVKVHVEPKALTICAALTESYFRPALKAAGIENPEDYCLWYDVTELILRPNRAKSAQELYESRRLSEDVMLREAGFDPESDKPSHEEFKYRLLLDLLFKQPDFAAGILPHLGITDVALPLIEPYVRGKIPPVVTEGPVTDDPSEGVPAPKKEPVTAPRNSGDSRNDRPATPANGPSGDSAPKPSGPNPGSHAVATIELAREVAVESLVSRGLEFANKKLLTRGRRGTFDGDIRRFYLDGGITVSRDQVARLLDGAWTYLGEVAESVGLDAQRLELALLDHVGGLLVTGQEHQRRYSRTIANLTTPGAA